MRAAVISEPAHGGSLGRRAAVFLIGIAALAVAVLGPYLAPQGWGGAVHRWVAGLLLLVILIGPIVRGVGPRRVWLPESVGALCLLVGLFQWLVPIRIGPLRFYDVCYALGYLSFVVWIVALYRHVGGGARNRTPLMDVVTIPLALFLGLWTVALAPVVDGGGLPSGLVEMMYPLADVLLVTMLVHLASRVAVVPTSLRWLIAALCMQFVFDLVFSLDVVVFGEQGTPWIAPWFVLTYGALAVVATHPSVVDLARRAPARRDEQPAQRGPTFIIMSMSTSVLAVAIPPRGAYDSVVRTVLVVALLAMLFLRLSRTMHDLYRAEADSRRRAMHDPLTGLLNRAALFDALADRMSGAGATVAGEGGSAGRQIAVLYLDCDDFKYVNDTWGHSAGDRLLRDMSARVAGQIGHADVLARHGGDEFVVVTRVQKPQEAVQLAERVRRAFDEPVRVLSTRLHAVTPSIGIAVVGIGDGTTPEEVLRRADAAMYEAKSRGRGRVVLFNDRVAQRSHTRALVGDRLEDALRENAFRLHLQPIMGGDDYGTLLGWEALARWHDPVLGHVPPDLFIEVAEQHGYIGRLGEFVLREACHELARLHEALGRTDLTISVNVSAVQLTEPDFAGMVIRARRDAGLSHDALRLEVTETVLLQEGPTMSFNLQRLWAGGVRMSIDDFGTGYASLASLLRLPVDCVKLDRTLVTGLGGRAGDIGDTRTLSAVVAFLQHLGIERVVAEGVETPEQAAALREIGCPMVQGYLFGRPAPAEEIRAAVRAAAAGPTGGVARG